MTRDYVYDQGFAAERAGFERDYGRRVVADLEDAGFTDARAEGRARMITSDDPGFDFFRLSFESLRSAIVDAQLSDAAVRRFRVRDRAERLFRVNAHFPKSSLMTIVKGVVLWWRTIHGDLKVVRVFDTSPSC